jgi:molecular chaperone DnaK (HSP70)
MKAFGKTPVDVVANYLRCLWQHATQSIQNHLGKHLWENLDVRIVITVPAIWDHKAQETTRRAAEMAGLMTRPSTTLELIGEPEAATLAVFNEMEAQRKRMLKKGDSFVVCDAGGGTVVSL